MLILCRFIISLVFTLCMYKRCVQLQSVINYIKFHLCSHFGRFSTGSRPDQIFVCAPPNHRADYGSRYRSVRRWRPGARTWSRPRWARRSCSDEWWRWRPSASSASPAPWWVWSIWSTELVYLDYGRWSASLENQISDLTNWHVITVAELVTSWTGPAPLESDRLFHGS